MKSKKLFLGLVFLAVGCQCNNPPCPEEPVCETYVHRYGVALAPEDWHARGQYGNVISKMKDGVTVSKRYEAGVQEGDTTYTFPHSQTVEKTETYANNVVVKESQNYPSGIPMKQVVYGDSNRKSVVSWYENGAPQANETYENDVLVEGEYYISSGPVDSKVITGQGTRTVRDQFGQLVSKDTIVDGQMVSQTTFYPNGAPKAITPFVGGTIHGEVTTFLAGGEPNTIEEWVNGVQQGPTIVFQNGERVAEVPYVAGIKQGVETRFVDGDTIVEEISWKNDCKEGPCRTYVGDKSKTRWYYQDREVTKAGYDVLTKPLP